MLKKSHIALVCSALFGMSVAYAIESELTKPVVGFKPVFQNTTGEGVVQGELKPAQVLTVDLDALQYFDEDGDPLDSSAVTYSWKLDGDELSTTAEATVPAGITAVGKTLTLAVTPVSQTGDPLEGNPVEFVVGTITYHATEPKAVTTEFKSTATVELNGDNGTRPVANKDVITASFEPAEGASPEASAYLFTWKAGGVPITNASGAGMTTYTPASDTQGKAISVEVKPLKEAMTQE